MTSLADRRAPSEFQSVLDPHTCTRRGLCPVTHVRQRKLPESQSLYFEVHGNGPQKIVFIMGVNHDASAWLAQVDHFGKLEQYSTLIFDNRGVGRSLCPLGPYSTGEMAEDTLCLLDYLQWTEHRSLHVVGISMGGMIAQELAYRIPNRILSLSLVATRAGGNFWANIPSPSVCLRFARSRRQLVVSRVRLTQYRLLATSDTDKHFPILEKILYPREWLDSLAEDDPKGRTNREFQQEACPGLVKTKPSDTFQHFHQRMAICKPQTLTGAFGQMAAVVTHRMRPDRLAKVSESVPKVLILSAVEDVAIPHAEGERLKRHMPEAEYQCWDKTGHGVCVQHKERFNRVLEKVFMEGEQAAGRLAVSD